MLQHSGVIHLYVYMRVWIDKSIWKKWAVKRAENWVFIKSSHKDVVRQAIQPLCHADSLITYEK